MLSKPMLSGIRVEDPLGGIPIGASISLEPVVFGDSDAKPVPDGVTNWTFFDGAVMTLVVKTSNATVATGTVVAIAPGLAVTATHILRDYLDMAMSGDAALLCAGPRDTGLELWDVRKINFTETEDIAFLGLELASSVSPGWALRTFPVTTRAPKPGERLHVVGFRLDASKVSGAHFQLHGDLYAASGKVVAVYHPRRDSVLMPFPTIEIACGSLGGMSGGAVLDDSGYLLGVVSRSLETSDGQGPTFAAWIVGALDRDVELTWPPGVYPPQTNLLHLDERLLRLEGREKLIQVDDTSYGYEVWFGE